MAKYVSENGIKAIRDWTKGQDNKSLYNLGAYDTITANSDGTYTITRQTGYIVLDGVKYKFTNKSSTTNNGLFYNSDINNYILKPTNNNIVADVVCNLLKTYSANTLYSNNINGISVTTDGILEIGLTTAITTINEANDFLVKNHIIIQYKLATQTTERVEKNNYARYNQKFILVNNKNEAERSANVFNIDDINSTYAIKISDTEFKATSTDYELFKTNFKENTQYTISGYSRNENTSYAGRLVIYYTDNTFENCLLNEGTSYVYQTFTSKANKTIKYISHSYSTGVSYSYYANLMINEGTEPLPYQPYDYSGHIENEQGRYLIEKEEEARNLFSKEGIDPNCYYNYSNGVRAANNDFSESDFISVQVNTQYYILSSESGYHVCFYDSNKTFISGTLSNPFTTPSNASYLRFAFRNTAINATMLLKGSKPLPYQPYNSKAHITNNEAEFLKTEHDRSANLLYVPNKTDTSDGITFTISNGIINVNGSNAASTYPIFEINSVYLQAGTYTINKSIQNEGLYIWVGSNPRTNDIIDTYKISATFTITTNMRVYIAIVSTQLQTYSNFKFSLMLNEGSVALPYQPYEGKVVHEKDIKNLSGVIGYGITQLYRHDIHFDITNGDGIECTFWSTSNNKITDFSQIPYLAFSNIQVKNISSEKILNVVQWNSDGFRFYEQGGLTELIGDAYDGVTAYYINGEPQL